MHRRCGLTRHFSVALHKTLLAYSADDFVGTFRFEPTPEALFREGAKRIRLGERRVAVLDRVVVRPGNHSRMLLPSYALKRITQRAIRNVDESKVRMGHIDDQENRSGNRQCANKQRADDRRVDRRQQTEGEEEQAQPEDQNRKKWPWQPFAACFDQQPMGLGNLPADLDGSRLQRPLSIGQRMQIPQFVLHGLDACFIARGTAQLVSIVQIAPDIAQPDLDHPSKEPACLFSLRAVMRHDPIKQDEAGNGRPQLRFGAVMAGIGGGDQEPECECRQGSDHRRCQLDHILGVGAQMVVRQIGTQQHPDRRRTGEAEEYDPSEQDSFHGLPPYCFATLSIRRQKSDMLLDAGGR
ncbi:hypothetical protein MESS2_1240016 [Mesorhizobium metallidurans STM 2683]|uniref:Uncharacterized protein n=1 Tax=Mesorhizobium metallidurans STM 2683 TaxID=1297569 RepID=M5EJG0_9HYPH|nr:hypothetical protein MESS2_1240016 [Mesorhizobium metallidurans STM 2683]